MLYRPNIQILNLNSYNPVETLKAPIGLNSNLGKIYFDIHENGQGPHIFIGGGTGSGKSQTLITILLSMATHYHPNDLSFILVDFKGGSLSNAFSYKNENDEAKDLPHIIGKLTNLDDSLILRAILAIESELTKREAIFADIQKQLSQLIDIYKYQELFKKGELNSLKITMPDGEEIIPPVIPHLVIVSDEFSELKEKSPEFVKKFINIVRIGRSLGVHLIVATQKPSSAVPSEMKDNCNGRVALKLKEASESKYILDSNDGVQLKTRGQVIIKSDNYLEVGMSAYSGAAYVESDV